MVEKLKGRVHKWLAATGVLTGVKVKIIAAAAITAVGVGGVVTYKQVTAPAEEPEKPVVQEVEQPEPQGLAKTSEGQGSPEVVRIEQQPPKVTANAANTEDKNITRSGGAKAGSDEDIAAGGTVVRKARRASRRGGGFGGNRVFLSGKKEESDSEDSNSTDDSDSVPRRRRSRRAGR
jgi:hypothetical protein